MAGGSLCIDAAKTGSQLAFVSAIVLSGIMFILMELALRHFANGIARFFLFIAIWILQTLWKKYGDHVTDKAKQQAAKYHGPGSDAVQQFAGSGDSTNAQTIMVELVVHESEV